MPRFLALASSAALSVALAVVSTPSPSHAGSCPPDTICGKEFLTPSASYSTGPVFAAREGTYDLITGTFSAHTLSILDGGSLVVIAQDEYTLTGVPGGAPVAFDLELEVTGTIVNLASFGASARREGGSIVSFSGSSDQSGTVVLHLVETPSQPFVIRYTIGETIYSLGTISEAHCNATFRFAGLPPGAHVTSCQGFVQESDPALPASWGAVKAAYR